MPTGRWLSARTYISKASFPGERKIVAVNWWRAPQRIFELVRIDWDLLV
jgi:hypothetical protein